MKRGLPPAFEVMATLDERLGTSWERPLWPHAMDGVGVQNYATRCSIVLNTHMVLRRHEEQDAVVLDAAVRSWPPRDPRCLRWAWPVWIPDDNLDPTALRREGFGRSSRTDEEEPPSYDAASFADRFLNTEPKSMARILDEAEGEGLSARRVKLLLELTEECGHGFRWKLEHKRVGYATRPQPEESDGDELGSTPSKRRAIEDLLAATPVLDSAEIAKRCGVSDRYVRRVRAEWGGEDHAD